MKKYKIKTKKQRSAASERLYIKTRNKMREDMMDRYGYIFCEKCTESYHTIWSMHHIIYRSEKPKHKELHNEKNLINLCKECHNFFHDKKERRAYLVDERGLRELFK